PPAAAPPPMAPATASVSAPATAAAAGVLGPLALARKRRASTAGRSALARLPRRARIALLAGEGSLARTLLLPLTLGRGCVLTRGRGPLRGLAVAAARAMATAGAIAGAGPIAPAGTIACAWAVAGATCLGQAAASRTPRFTAIATLFVEAARDVLRRALPRGLSLLSLVFSTHVRVTIADAAAMVRVVLPGLAVAPVDVPAPVDVLVHVDVRVAVIVPASAAVVVVVHVDVVAAPAEAAADERSGRHAGAERQQAACDHRTG